MTIQSFEIVSTDPQLYVVVTNDDGSTWGQLIELPRNISAENDVKEYVWKFLEKRKAEIEEYNVAAPNLQSLQQISETAADRRARLPKLVSQLIEE